MLKTKSRSNAPHVTEFTTDLTNGGIIVWFYLFFWLSRLSNILNGLWSWVYNIFAILRLCLFLTLKQLNFSSLNRIIPIQFSQTMQFPSTELFHWKTFFLWNWVFHCEQLYLFRHHFGHCNGIWNGMGGLNTKIEFKWHCLNT